MKTFLVKLINTIWYIFVVWRYEGLKDFVQMGRVLPKCPNGKIHVLANGPSLKGAMDEIDTNWEKYRDDDFCAVNYVAESEIYTKIKPKYYFLSDPMFFFDNLTKSKKAHELVKLLNERTAWNMNLYVPKRYYNDFQKNITNKYITLIPLHCYQYDGFESLRFKLYKHGLGNGEFGTIVCHAIYTTITLGYKELFLYGVDHTFLDNIVVTQDNVLCSVYKHFYDNGYSELEPKPIKTPWDKNYTVASYLMNCYAMFNGHELMNSYAEYMGCKVWNCTKGSLIDSYEKNY